MGININGKKVYPSVVYTIYFTVMFLFYTQTYIQLAVQLMVCGFVGFSYVVKIANRKKNKQHFGFFILWFGGFFLLMYLSQRWAYDVLKDSKTLLTTFRIFVIGLTMFMFVDSKEKALSLLQSFIIGCVIMESAVLLFEYKAIGTTGFGVMFGQHRNTIGAVSASLTFLCYYLYKCYGMKSGKNLSIFFAVMVLCTGSRTSFIQVVFIFVVIMLMSNVTATKKVKNIIWLMVIAGVALLALRYIPYLHDVIWVRVMNAISTVGGGEVLDRSAQGRDYYKAIAYDLFIDRPIYGYGVDGFRCFLTNNPYYVGWFMEARYSHCNYAEIAANFGTIGLLIWYIPVLFMLIKITRARKHSLWITCIFAVYVSMILSDYSRIPWSSHYGMYPTFIIFLLYLHEFDGVQEKLI